MNMEASKSAWRGRPISGSGVDLDIRQLVMRFGAREVLHALDLSVSAGEFVAVIGRSGCGKTTLLRLVAGLAEATSGSIRLGNEPVKGVNAHAKLLFQEARLLPWATVVQNIGISREPGWREKALHVLKRVGLEGRGNDWPYALSGGQKQRVALARALVSKPNILLLDEPFGALDALTRLEMHGLLQEAWEDDGFTTLLITHDVAEAVALADRIIVLQEGRITLDRAIDLPRPRRAVGEVATARLQAEILSHLT